MSLFLFGMLGILLCVAINTGDVFVRAEIPRWVRMLFLLLFFLLALAGCTYGHAVSAKVRKTS